MRAGILLAAAFLALPLPAQEPAAKPDFGPGFKRLAALGLPAMKDAVWVKTPPDAALGSSLPYELRELGIRLQGGAWHLPNPPAKLLAPASYKSLDWPPAGTGEPKPPGATPPEPPRPAKPTPPPAAADLEADVKQIVEALTSDKKQKTIADTFRYHSNTDWPGSLLLFATQIDAAGNTDLANRLAAAVFAACPDATAVVDGAIARLAGDAYQEAAAAFFENHDWRKFHDTLAALLEKFPRGWTDAAAVSMFLPALQQRAANQPVAAPSLPGLTVPPAALAALDDLLKPPVKATLSDEDLLRQRGIDPKQIPAAQRARVLAMLRARSEENSSRFDDDFDSLWILTDPSPAARDQPLGRIHAMHLDGVLALAAVVTDDTLTHYQSSGSYRSSRSVNFSLGQAEDLLRRLAELPHPASRGEIAAAMLESVVPPGNADEEGAALDSSSDEERDPAALRAAAIAFWQANHGKSKNDLALVYLKRGSRQQHEQALAFLAGSKDPAANAAFEHAVLTADTPLELLNHVRSYLQARKSAAKDFYEAYAKILRTALADAPPEDIDRLSRWEPGNPKTIDGIIKQLAVCVGTASLADLLEEYLHVEKQEAQTKLRSLAQALASATTAQILEAVAKVAPKAPPDRRLGLFQLLESRSSRTRRYASPGDEEPEAEQPKDEPAVFRPPDATAREWSQLIADSTPIPPELTRRFYFSRLGAKSLGDAAAIALEVCCDPQLQQNLSSYCYLLEDTTKALPLLVKRATARLAGQGLPPFPDAKTVPRERGKEILAKVAALPPAEIPAFIRSLTESERAAWLAKVTTFAGGESPDEEPDPGAANDAETPPESLLALRAVVATIPAKSNDHPDHDPALLQKIGIEAGFQVTADSLAKLAEAMLSNIKEVPGLTIELSPSPLGLGLLARATPAKAKKPAADDEPDFTERSIASALPMLFRRTTEQPDAIALISYGRNVVLWQLKEGKISPLEVEGAPATAIDDLKADLKTTLESKAATLAPIQLAVLARPEPQPEE